MHSSFYSVIRPGGVRIPLYELDSHVPLTGTKRLFRLLKLFQLLKFHDLFKCPHYVSWRLKITIKEPGKEPL